MTSGSELPELAGPARAAALLLALGEETGGKLMALLDDDELREISRAMVALGPVPSETIERLCVEFAGRMGKARGVSGSAEAAEKLLRKMIPAGRVERILEDIKGPSGRNIWDKLGKVNESVLADYLCHEHPQTAAMVLSRVTAEHAARVISLLPEGLALDIIERMLTIESLQREAIDDVERTLKVDFMVNLASSVQRDPHEKLAEIFNAFDRTVEGRIFAALETRNEEAAGRIRSLMFTFDDLVHLAPRDVQTLLAAVDKDRLPVALKGASEKVRELFMSNVTERAGKMLRDEIEMLGPVRLRDVDAAQQSIVTMAKELAARDEIEISTGKDDDVVI